VATDGAIQDRNRLSSHAQRGHPSGWDRGDRRCRAAGLADRVAVSLDCDVAAENAPLFFLDGRTLNPLQVNNQTFGIADLQEGMTIGIAKITVNTSA
jgi:hypothetical protein